MFGKVPLDEAARRRPERLVERRIRLETLRKSRRERRPVVHLHVDVVPVARAPRRFVVRRPHALKVRRHRAGTRRRDEQIPPELEQPLHVRRVGETDGGAFHQPRKVGDMPCPHRLVSLRFGGGDGGADTLRNGGVGLLDLAFLRCPCVTDDVSARPVYAVRVADDETFRRDPVVRSAREERRRLVRATHFKRIAPRDDLAIRFERQESVELDVVVLEVLDRLDGSSARRDATGASIVRLGAYAEFVRIGNLQLQVERKRSFLRCRILHGKDAVGV